MSILFALKATGTSSHIYRVAERLGFEGSTEAQSISIFELDYDRLNLEALYETAEQAETAKQSLADFQNIDLDVNPLPQEDWVAISQSYLAPIRSGRFMIYGSHDAHMVTKDVSYPICIDAGNAFGTGHHPTTQGCLRILDAFLLENEPETILDLGCGAGILAIAAAKASRARVIASDYDIEAVETTKQNITLNNVSEKITVFHADGFKHPKLKDTTFHLIIANILAGPLASMADDIIEAMEPKALVILSGILNDQVDKIYAAYEVRGIKFIKTEVVGDWITLLGEKNPVV